MKLILLRASFILFLTIRLTSIYGQTSPDLIVSGIEISNTVVQPGSLVNITYNAKNIGAVQSPYSYSGFYLSADTVLDSNDPLMGYDYVEAVNAGDSSYNYCSFEIPVSTANGSYYLFAAADFNNMSAEQSEGNNTKIKPLSVGPVNADLVLQNITSPSVLVPGQSASVHFKYINLGMSYVTVSYMIALSTDTVLNQNDPLVNYQSYNYGLWQNQPSNVNSSITIPATTVPGSYYLLYIADYDHAIDETNESNNIKYFPLNIVPKNVDLLISAEQVIPATIAAGNNCIVSFSLANLGTTDVATDATEVFFYISKDTVYDQSDIEFYHPYSSSAASVALNDSTVTHVSVIKTISTSVAPGNYFLLMLADQFNRVDESNHTNNSSYIPITITAPGSEPPADIAIMSGSISGNPLTAGEYANISSSVYFPEFPAAASYLRYYLSSDTLLDNNDYSLSSTYLEFSGNDTIHTNYSCQLPANLAGGQYYLVLELPVPANDPVAYNNRKFIPTIITPPDFDLQVNALSIASSIICPGNQLTVTAEAYNVSVGQPGSFQVAYYISNDSLLDNGDLLLQFNYNGFYQQDTIRMAASVKLPLNIGYGNKYILCQLDKTNIIQEINENNNVVKLAVNIVPPDIDLAFHIPFPGVNNPYTPSYIQWTENIINAGTTPSNHAYVSYYISQDTILDASDDYLTTKAIGTIIPGGNSNYTHSWWLGNLSPAGSFYLISRIDPYNDHVETYENNNITWTYFQQPPPPSIELSLAQPVLSKSADVFQSPVRITCKLLNNGISRTGNVTTKYFLSADSLFSSNDILLKDYSSYNLNPFGSDAQSFDINFPYNTVPGNYYIVVVTDPDNIVPESNENNNKRAIPYSILAQSIDFSLNTPLVTPSAMIAGRSTSVYFNNVATGNFISSNINPQVGVFLSADTIADASDIVLGSISYQNSVIIPLSVPDGSYYVLIIVDNNNYFSETNEANNSIWYPVTVQHEPQGIDLVIGSASNPSTALAGTQIVFTHSVNNIGPTPVYDPIVTGFYLSTDSVWGEADVFLNRVYPNYYSSVSYLEIPENIIPGNYYIMYFVDYQSTYGETNEFNNTYGVPITILPSDIDLSIIQPMLPDTLKTHNQANITFKVKNSGSSVSPAFSTSVYLSTDPLFGYSDEAIGGTYSSTVNANDSVSLSSMLYLGDGTAPGNYYLLVIADQADYYGSPVNYVAESNENNNMLAVPVYIERADIDLAIADLQASVSTGIAGTTIPIEFKAVNYGDDASRHYYMNFYLSPDTILSQGDQNISGGFSYQVNTIPGNSYVALNPYVSLWVESSGNYYILVEADRDDENTETNESNNISWYPITVIVPDEDSAMTNVDLEIQSPSAAPNVAAGAHLTVGATIHNSGPAAAQNVRIEYYLSTDNVYSADDHSFYSSHINSVSGGGSSTRYDQLWINTLTAAGNYYLVFKTYCSNAYDRDWNDNISIVPVTVTQPLIPTTDLSMSGALTGTAPVYPGSVIGLTSTLYNNDNDGTAYRVNYCLSKDLYFDSFYQDVRLTPESFDSIQGNGSVVINPVLNLPLTAEPGNYFIIAMGEPGFNITDTDSSNNFHFIPVTISPAHNDFSIPSVIVPGDTIENGNTIATTHVFNGGASASYPAKMAYYLSSDAVLSSDDIYLRINTLNSISSIDDTIISQFVSLPPYVVAGNYYLLNYADHLSQVIETDEFNNINSIPVNVGVIGIQPVTAGKGGINVFPNPTAGKFTLKINETANGQVEIYNELGIKIRNEQVRNNTGTLAFDLENVPSGIYVVRYISGEKVLTTKLIVQ
ncbi:MAG TPA: CARDB domain-containing protein [Bacteroidia bacterium]|jgi:subtilase family serine protease